MRGVCCALLVGCGSVRVPVDVPVEFVGGPSVVVPAEGVELTLSEAQITVSDLRLESPAVASWRPSISLIPVAHAHPGHDFDGGVSGELLGTWTLDLLGDGVELGAARMLEGDYATARLTVDDEVAFRFVGEADVDGSTVPFDLQLSHGHEITGIVFDAVMDSETPPGGLVLSFELAHALSFVDWRTDPGDDDQLTVLDGALVNTLTFGVVSTPSWTLGTEE